MSRPKKIETDMMPLENKAITQLEVVAVLSRCGLLTKSPEANRRYYAYFRTLWETGLRPGEVLAIKARDVLDDAPLGPRIRVFRLKKAGHPADFVPCRAALILVLRGLTPVPKAPHGRLFPYTSQAVCWAFDNVKPMAGIRPHLTLHSFRHGFAFNYIKNRPDQAVALTELQRWLGHSNLTTTSQYVRAGYTQLQTAVKGMRF